MTHYGIIIQKNLSMNVGMKVCFYGDISNPFIPRYWISNYTDINWKGGHKFEWAYVDDVMMLMEKMMRFNDCKNEDQ